MDVSKYLNENLTGDNILSVDQLPNLQKSRGKKFDKIRFAVEGDDKPSKRYNITNTVITQMAYKKPSDAICPVNDAIVGVASLEWGTSKSLSATTIYNVLQTVYNINTTTVMQLTGLSTRQAQRYVKACKIVLPVLESTFKFEDEECICPDELTGFSFGNNNDLGDY